MSAPVKNTCPDIDKYIKQIKWVLCKRKDLQNMKESDLLDTAINMNDELENCIDYLEDLRASNDALRSWGTQLDEELEAAAATIAELEGKIEP